MGHKFRQGTLAGTFAVASAGSAYAAGPVVAGFNSARGGFESFQENTGLANDISTAFPGTTFTYSSTLTPSFLSGANVVVLGVAVNDELAITPLSSSEQSALFNFVKNGGTAIIFADNSTFDVDDPMGNMAPEANASLVSPFGATITGTLNGTQLAPIKDLTGPLTSPFTPVTEFQGLYTGYFSNLGGGQDLADWAANEPAIDYFAPKFFGPQSGAVVLFADSDAMVAGDSLTTTNENLVLNAFGTYTLAPPPPTIPEPSTWAMVLLGFAGLGFAGYRKAKGVRTVPSAV